MNAIHCQNALDCNGAVAAWISIYSNFVCSQQLRHDHLVNLIEVFRRKKRLYLVFEFVDHTVLDELEKCPNGLDENTCRKILWQVLKGTEFCHLHHVSFWAMAFNKLLIEYLKFGWAFGSERFGWAFGSDISIDLGRNIFNASVIQWLDTKDENYLCARVSILDDVINQ